MRPCRTVILVGLLKQSTVLLWIRRTHYCYTPRYTALVRSRGSYSTRSWEDKRSRHSWAHWCQVVIACRLSFKEGRKPAFSVNYIRLNAETVQDSFKISRMDEWIDPLGEVQIFSSLNTFPSYWQTDLNDETLLKTTFASHHLLFNYPASAVRAEKVSALFQWAMDFTLASVNWQNAIV